MYSIKEVAGLCGLSAYTIRFYDKEGLLPFITRNGTGNRQFSESDLDMIRLICCLKNTGMQLKEIKRYIDLFMEGDQTIPCRKQMMIDHRDSILRQISELQTQMNVIEMKISFYEAEKPAAACCCCIKTEA
jgi:DNA-binding transcriptional MerR regulator